LVDVVSVADGSKGRDQILERWMPRRDTDSLELMSAVNVAEHACFEELLTFPRRLLPRLDVNERVAEPADEYISGEGFRPR